MDMKEYLYACHDVMDFTLCILHCVRILQLAMNFTSELRVFPNRRKLPLQLQLQVA